MGERASARVRRRRRAWTMKSAIACVGACASIAARARGADARAHRADDTGAKILYVHAPASESFERDVERLRCYAAVAKASGRTLVLVDADAEAARGERRDRRRPATDYVVPAANGGLAPWRRWREGDDKRAKSGNVRWCAQVEHGTTMEASRAVEERFRGARAACVAFQTVDRSCGADDVDMVLTSKVDFMATLPRELEGLVKSGVVRESVLAPALGGASAAQSRLAIVEERIAERVAARIEERHQTHSHIHADQDVNHTALLAASEPEAQNGDKAATQGIPESKVLTTAARRTNGSGRKIDTSRALVLFAAAVGVVGFFVNSFGFAKQASKRDELAALMLDPSASFGASRKKKVVQKEEASPEVAVAVES